MGFGVGREVLEITFVGFDELGVRIEPGGSVPPTGGGWCLYHSFSVQLTMLDAP
jgi:hypothetical protein